MINKFVETAAEAIGEVNDGATVLMGGFGEVGQAELLIEALAETGARNLTVVANNAGYGEVGLARLLKLGRVAKIICSFPRVEGSTIFEELYSKGKIELELVPQGTLAERIRAAGAGIPAFYTATGAGTELARDKEVLEINGKPYIREYALSGDLGLVEAWAADRWGNLTFKQSGRNFNPLVAFAATTTVVQCHQIAEFGTLDPEHIVTPGTVVDRVVQWTSEVWQ